MVRVERVFLFILIDDVAVRLQTSVDVGELEIGVPNIILVMRIAVRLDILNSRLVNSS